MKVADMLGSKGYDVQTIYSWSSTGDAIRRLAGPPTIGALVVCDNGRDGVTGLITERDVVRGLSRHGGGVTERPVGDLMSRHVPVCSPQDSLAQVMAQMTRWRFRHLPVLQDGVLCGLLSIGDAVQHRLKEVQLESDVLRDMYLAHQ